MSLYQCEKCGCIENTACGWYWGRLFEGSPDRRSLCSACAPQRYSDGSSTEFNGTWHGEFERTFHPIGTMVTNRDGNVEPKK